MKTVSTKLDTTKHEELINECNKEGITPSEKIRRLVQDDIEMCKGWKDVGASEEIIKHDKEIMKKIPTSHEASFDEDDNGFLRKAEYVWFTDEEEEEKKELKIIVEDVA